MADMRRCNRCGVVRPHGTCSSCGCPEFTLVRDPQMRLWSLVLVCLLVAGCKPQPSGLPLEDRVGVGVAMAMAVAQEPPAPLPEPAPQPPAPPRPGGICPECEGRGKVSRDGVIWSKCLPCNGTGKVQGTAAEPKRMRTVYRQVCDEKTGKCTLIPEQEPIQ